MAPITVQTAIQRQLVRLQADFSALMDHCIAQRVIPPQSDDVQRRLDKLQRWVKLPH